MKGLGLAVSGHHHEKSLLFRVEKEGRLPV